MQVQAGGLDRLQTTLESTALFPAIRSYLESGIAVEDMDELKLVAPAGSDQPQRHFSFHVFFTSASKALVVMRPVKQEHLSVFGAHVNLDNFAAGLSNANPPPEQRRLLSNERQNGDSMALLNHSFGERAPHSESSPRIIEENVPAPAVEA